VRGVSGEAQAVAAGGGSSDGSYDLIVVGAGIVGLATALRALEAAPGMRLLVLDKEAEVGQHQTGHNSGVIHRGVYYTPGSLKARLCVAGAEQMIAFCDEHEIPYRMCGKLIIAVDESEIPKLDELQRRGAENGVPGLRRIEGADIREIEPTAAGVAALHSPETAIVDFSLVARVMAREVTGRGGRITLSAAVTGIQEQPGQVAVRTASATYHASVLVTCAGLQSDQIAGLDGHAHTSDSGELRIIPFRGDYFELRPGRSSLSRGLIYPVPDARFPFLGVHFTPRITGEAWVGPNAVLAFAREGYRLQDVSLRDLYSTLSYPGFWRVAAAYWRTGIAEMWRGVSRRAFASALRRYVPEIRTGDLAARRAGVRAQAVARDGSLVDDFVITGTERVIHVRNAPSPAATSSLAIGEVIARRALDGGPADQGSPSAR
jgi:(S)-2-hydroxyglutarate dehydrogenase